MRCTGWFKQALKGGARWVLYPLLLVVVLAGMPGVSLIHAANSANISGQAAWASPGAEAVKRVGDVSNTQHQPTLFSNLDCTALSYRLTSGGTMQTGCFTPTAFGMLDSDSERVIFNGTDKAVPLLPHVAHEVLAPWPKALNMLMFSSADTGGSYVNMYNNPLAVMRDQRNALGQLTGKQLTAAPDTQLRAAGGQPLVVNPQATAFSDSGSWLVVETTYGYFARINLASLEVVPFAPSFNSQGGSTPQNAQVAISSDGRFAAIENGTAPSFKVYDLATCGGNNTSWQANNCQSHEYWPFASQQVPGFRTVLHLRFINDSLLSFEVPAGGSATSGTYELAPTANITSLTGYIGLGDSYTSGEGAYDYLPGTDTADNTCHLSANSYPLLLSHDLYGAAGGHSVACSGAVINDIIGTGSSYAGQVRHGVSLGELEAGQSGQLDSILADYSAGYVPQQLFVKQYQPRVVTVSVGGNDIGFGDILQECVVPHISRHVSDDTCYNTYESRQEVVNLVDRTVPRWITLYQQLRAASPASTIYVIGYPSIASDTGSCPLNVNLSKSELEFAEELIHYLNGSIQEAAAAAGVPYVDISGALAGHRLCEAYGSAVAVNGLTAGNDFGEFGVNVLGRESYHPNALGHELIEQAILRQTNNLSLAANGQEPASPANNDSQDLLDAPKSGRPVNALVPDTITSQLMRPGSTVAVRVDGARDGLQPSSTYAVRLDGASGVILASLSGDPSGNLSGIVDIPNGITVGGHTIDITGSSQDGEPVDVKQPVYVASSPDDTDGDGVADADDTCPYAVNSGQDVDGDGIDDVCDAIIGPPVSATSGSVDSDKPMDNEPGGQDLGAKTGQPTGAGTTGGAAANLLSLSASAGKTGGGDVGGGRTSGRLAAAKLAGRVLFSVFALLVALFSGWRYRQRIIKMCRVYLSALCNILCKIDYKNWWLCFTIVIMRKFGVAIFSVVLFISLLALALSTSSNIAFTHPSRLKQWLNDSNLYGAFVENAIDQAEQTAGTDQSGGISLSDTAVKQFAESSFSSATLQQDVNTFINSNYAWLNGKTTKPSFSIDLSGAKQSFAQKVGSYVKTYLTGLPACTLAQAAQINPQTADPLTLSCLPPGVDPATVGTQVTQQIASSTEFLSNPVVTAANVNPNGSIQSPAQPYYQKFSSLPTAYREATKVPWVAGGLAILSLVAVIFVAPRKRKGLKVVTFTLALAGLVMVLTKLVSDQAFRTIEKHAFNASTVGDLQKALTVFLRYAENQLVKVDLWFGIGYLVLATVLLATLIITRQRGLRIPKRLQTAVPAADSTPTPAQKSTQHGNSIPPNPKPRPPKPPRLVQ